MLKIKNIGITENFDVFLVAIKAEAEKVDAKIELIPGDGNVIPMLDIVQSFNEVFSEEKTIVVGYYKFDYFVWKFCAADGDNGNYCYNAIFHHLTNGDTVIIYK